MRFYFFLLVFTCNPLLAQSVLQQCLFNAQSQFKEGQLTDAEATIQACLADIKQKGNQGKDKNSERLTRLQKEVELLRLLTEVQLFLQKQPEAVLTYNRLLRKNPFFRLDYEIDHPEVLQFADKFTVVPRWSIGLSTFFVETKILHPGNESRLNSYDSPGSILASKNYRTPFYTMIGLQLEYQWSNKVGITTGVKFTPTGFKYGYVAEYEKAIHPTQGEESSAILNFTEEQQWFYLPLNLQYSFPTLISRIRFTTLFSANAGLEMGYLRSAEIQDISLYFDQIESVVFTNKLPAAEIMLLRNHWNVLLNVGGTFNFISVHSPASYFIQFQVGYMLSNLVNSDQRMSDNRLRTVYNHIDDDLAQLNFFVGLGAKYHFYKVKFKP